MIRIIFLCLSLYILPLSHAYTQPVSPSEFVNDNDDFAILPKNSAKSSWFSFGSSTVSIDDFINSIKNNYYGLKEDKIRSVIGTCYLFEKNIAQCEPADCMMLNPIMASYEDIKIKKKISGRKEGKCLYSQDLDNGALLNCELDKDGVEAIANIHIKTLQNGNVAKVDQELIKLKDKVFNSQCYVTWDEENIKQINDPTKLPEMTVMSDNEDEEDDKDEEDVREQDDKEMTVFEKEKTYRTQAMPKSFVTKFRKFNKENRHLPVYSFYNDYEIEFLKAAKEGDANGIRAILNLGTVSINYQDNFGNSAIHYAAYNNENNVLNLLLAKGADVNLTNLKGETAIMIAAANDNVEMINLLYDKKADVHIRDNYERRIEDIALENESLKSFNRIIQLISKKEKNLHSYKQSIITENVLTNNVKNVRFLLESGFNPNYIDDTGNSLLHKAAENGYSNLVQLLISAGAEVDVKNKKGLTASYVAKQNGYFDIHDLIETLIIKKSFSRDADLQMDVY